MTSTEFDILVQRAAAELKFAGAREIYAFGSAAKGTGDAASDLDVNTPFTRHLRTENELVRVG